MAVGSISAGFEVEGWEERYLSCSEIEAPHLLHREPIMIT